MFKPYELIQTYQDITQKSQTEQLSLYENDQWVVTEQIHGRNFSFIYNDSFINVCNRSTILSHSDKFYCHESLLIDHSADIVSIY